MIKNKKGSRTSLLPELLNFKLFNFNVPDLVPDLLFIAFEQYPALSVLP